MTFNPKHFRYVQLAPDPVCKCGHTSLEHRLDKTCRKCICIRWLPEGKDES